MVRSGRSSRVVVLLLPFLTALAPPSAAGVLQESSPAPPVVTLATDAEREAFLSSARIVRVRSASKGVTNTLRATLSDGRVTHEASIQTVDEARTMFETPQGTELNFKDSWRYNVAAYRIDRLLGLHMVPVTVARFHQSKAGSFTWWVDDVLMDEQEHYRKKRPTPDIGDWNQQMWMTRLFDQLIANVDRNLGNLLIDKAWNVWMIDHSRAFRLNTTPRSPGNLSKVERQLLERLRQLDRDGLRAAVGDHLTSDEVNALLKRRDYIVAHFDKGGPALVFERRPRCC